MPEQSDITRLAAEGVEKLHQWSHRMTGLKCPWPGAPERCKKYAEASRFIHHEMRAMTENTRAMSKDTARLDRLMRDLGRELDYAEHHTRLVVGDEPQIATGIVRHILSSVSAPSRPTPADEWETLRKDSHWPTPNAMRRMAAALDDITPAKHGDILRYVADLCDAATDDEPPRQTRTQLLSDIAERFDTDETPREDIFTSETLIADAEDNS